MKLRILQIGPVPPTAGGKGFGGIATHVWDLSSHLAKRGHQVAILAENLPESPEHPAIKDGVRIYGVSKVFVLKYLPHVFLNVPVIYMLKKHFRNLIRVVGIAATFCWYDYVIHQFMPDIIHVHSLEFRFPFAYSFSEGEIPIVTTVHSLSSLKFFPRKRQSFHRLLADNLEFCRDLIFVSDSLRRDWNHLFRDYGAKTWVINNPLDMARYHPVDKSEARRKIGLSSENPILLFIGRLARMKGIYVLLEAARLLKESGSKFKLVIVGDGEEREGVREFIIEKDVADAVAFEGPKQYPDLLYYYNAASLFITPSFSEGFPLTFLEAMGCGIPVVGTNIISKETIPSEDVGFRVPVNDARALAEAIRIGINRKWNESKILEHARHFSWETKLTDYEKVYESVVSSQ